MSQVAIDHVEIRWRPMDSAGAWTTEVLKPGQSSVSIPDVGRGQTYQIEARNVGVNGATSPWTQQTHEVDAANIKPSAPTNVVAATVPTGIQISWTNPTNQSSDVEYDLERCGNVNGNQPDGNWVNLATLRGSQFVDPITDPAVYWYRLRAVNFQGLYSDYTAPVVVDGTVQSPTNVATEDDNSTAITLSDGTSMSRLLVTWTASTDPQVQKSGMYEVQYQLSSPTKITSSPLVSILQPPSGIYLTPWVGGGIVGSASTYLYIDGISAFQSVNVRVRAIRANGLTSDWDTLAVAHFISRPVPIFPIGGNGPIFRFNPSGRTLDTLEPAEAGAEKTTGKDFSLLAGRTADKLNYLGGGTVDSLRPAQAGADVTAQSGNVLIQNPNFEARNAGWDGVAYQILAGLTYQGAMGYYGQLAPPSDSSGAYLVNLQNVPCSEGSVISASCFVSGYSANGTGSVMLVFFTADQDFIGIYYGNAVSNGDGWVQSRLSMAAPAGTAYFCVGSDANGTAGLWNFSGFSAAIYPNSQDEVPDGKTFYRATLAQNKQGHGVFLETFDTDITTNWILGRGSLSGVTFPTDGVTGGKTLCVSGVETWLEFPSNIPYDPSKLYRIRTRIRKLANTNNSVCTVGITGIAADGVTYCNTGGGNAYNSQHYIGVHNANPAVSTLWTEYTGYFKGTALGGSVDPSTDPSNPAVLQSGVRYIHPMVDVGYGNPTGDAWEVDYIAIDIVPESLDIIADSPTYRRVAASHVAAGGILQYTGGGTLDSLKPLEAGAEKTTGKDFSLLAGRTADKVSYTAGGTVDSLKPLESGANVTETRVSLQAANLNNHTLDNLGDGGSYKRVAASHVASGGILQYTSGGTIDSLKPAQTGADVTSSHTAADTSAVNGVASSTVKLATTGSQRNLVPDSDFKFGWTYWSPWTAGTYVIAPGGGADGGNGLRVGHGTGTQIIVTSPLMLTPGVTYTFSGYIDNSQSSQAAGWIVQSAAQSWLGSSIQNGGYKGRVSFTFTVPAGVTQAMAFCDVWDLSAITSGQYVYFSNPQLEIGSVATAYKPNTLDDTTGYLKAGTSQIDLASSIHLNKHLGNIADYGGRYAAAESGANVTKNHILTAVAQPSSAQTLSGSLAAITGFGWSVNTAQTADVYNIWASIDLAPSASGNQVIQVELIVDGNTGSPSASRTLFLVVGLGQSMTFPFYASVTNLSVGAHTIQFYMSVVGSGTYIVTDSYAICQRIY